MNTTVNSARTWEGLTSEVSLLSSEMLDLAQAGEWDAVTEREERRRHLIHELFAQPLPTVATSTVQACIREVLASDAEVLVLGHLRRDDLAQKLETTATSRKVHIAYAPVEP